MASITASACASENPDAVSRFTTASMSAMPPLYDMARLWEAPPSRPRYLSRARARRMRPGMESAVCSHDSSGRLPVRWSIRLKPLMTPNL